MSDVSAEILKEYGISTNGNGKHKEPDYSEIDRMLAECKFDLGKPPAHLDYIFTILIEGKRYQVGAFGNIGLIMGAAKSRKTNFLKGLVAAGLSGESFLNMNLELRGKRAVYFDTEQGDQYFFKTQEQAHLMAKKVDNLENYDAFMMRKWSTEQRIEGIERYLATAENLGLIIIDGIVDLVKGFNDETECSKVIQKLMTWTVNTGAMLICVIHTNRTQFKNAMGHLGAFLEKKCDFQIDMNYNEETRFTTVKHRPSRTQKFPDFDFTQNEEGYPVLNHNEKIEIPDGVGGFRMVGGATYSNQPEKDPFAAPFVATSSVITRPARMNEDEDVPF